MAGLTSQLLLKISSDTAELQKGLQQAKSQVDSFQSSLGEFKNYLIGAFSVAAVGALGKQLFDLASSFDDITGKIDDLGNHLNLAANTGKVKALADTFNVDVDKVIEAANATAKQFGISFGDSLDYIQKGLGLAGPRSEKFLKSLESTSGQYSALGGSADSFFTIVTDGYRTSSNWEKTIQDGTVNIGKSFSDLTNQMTEDQKAQQTLINNASAFNAELANLFEDTNDRMDAVKATLYDIGLKAFRAVKQGVVDTVNYFLDLYNQSLLFRATVQSIVFYFKELWEVVKLVANVLIDAFKLIGKAVGAILKGNFSELGKIFSDSMQEVVSDGKKFGQATAENFIDAAKAVLSKDKIKLIEAGSITEDEGGGSTKATDKSKALGEKAKKEVAKKSDLSKLVIPVQLKINEPDFNRLNQAMDKIKKNLKTFNLAWQDFGLKIKENIKDRAGSAMQTFTQNIQSMAQTGTWNLQNLANSFLDVTKQTIAASLAASLAGAIQNAFELPFPLDIAAAGIATAAVYSLFAAIPSFATGTDYFQGGLARINEKGGEIVTLPTGSQIIPHDISKSLVNGAGSGSMKIQVVGKIRGKDIWFLNNDEQRRRNNTI